MFKIEEYRKEYDERILTFLEKAFTETGKEFNRNGKHSFYSDIKTNFEKFWCLFDEEELIGTVGVKPLNENSCELKSLYVYKKYHGQKLGYRLMTIAIEYAKKVKYHAMLLDTISTKSERAIHLYERMGFERIERYNQNELADVFMKLNL